MSIVFSGSDPSALENLSALSDGELDAGAVAHACGTWRDDAGARACWHAYHLIGDVLRSDDLASAQGRDAAFLSALRIRLADEPVVLAPEPMPESASDHTQVPRKVANGSRGTRWSWMAPSAVAAGFVLVAGALIVTRTPLPGSDADTTLASESFPATSPQMMAAPTLASSEAGMEPPVMAANGRLLRDPRIDRYLAAHKQFAGSSMLGVPSGFLRNAAAEAPNR
jgi:sigma-E factor negative regulatory protein RseA